MITLKQDNRQTLVIGGWRSRFHTFLFDKSSVSEEKATYFVRWMEQFLETANVKATRLAPERVSAILDELSHQEEPWKVRQVREAIRLYRYFEETREGRRADPDA